MSDGMREGFVENDVLGNTNDRTINLFGSRGKTFARRRSKSRRKVTSCRKHSKRVSRKGKPQFGTKAWMTYIRGMRGKKHKSKKSKRRKRR